MNKKKFRKVEPYIWMAPSMILMGIFIIIPIFVILRMSLSKVTRAGIVKEFTGFDNFFESNPYIGVSDGVKKIRLSGLL